MSITQGLSGLQAVTRSLEVIGNNIANAGTYGAKASRAEFAEVYSNSLGAPGESGAGSGVKVTGFTQRFTQGGISTTGNAMDLAIDGRGFFMLQDSQNKELYSRNGQFQVDRDGYVVNAQGLKLLGTVWDDTAGRGTGVAQAMRMNLGAGDVVQTGKGADASAQGTRLALNLDSRASVPAAAFDMDNPASYNFSTSQTVYDGQGTGMTMTYFFRKTAANEWEMRVALDDQEVTDPATPPALVFGADGRLDTAASDTSLALDIDDGGTPPTPIFTGLPVKLGNMTQFSGSFAVTEMRQDGFSYGELTGVSFDDNGVLQASYSNGHVKNLYQLQLADFTSLNGLRPIGGNAWESTAAAGSKVVNAPGSNGIGLIQGGSLEQSNIDLTTELVDMITAQRMYQANAQTIKTMDQALQTLVNLR